MSSSTTTHLAAISLGKGQPLEVQSRPTPKPGPGELLVLVKSVALNPADGLMRDLGLFIVEYPTVIGFDMAGLVLEAGDDVPDDATPGGISFRPGITRVAAHSASYWRSWAPDYGIFQERCLIPWQHATPLPDDSMSWNEAATLPVATVVALNAWGTLGFTVPTSASASASHPVLINSTGPTTRGGEDAPLKSQKREALLIWGASSSVGTMGVQTARLIREDVSSPVAAVYATSGPANMKYVESLGADRVFDYKDPGVVEAIVAAATEDGVVIRHCFLAMGHLALCQAVLKVFLVEDEEGGGKQKRKAAIGSAPPLPADAEILDGVETVFLEPSTDEVKGLEQVRYWMGTWLRESLEKRLVKPSPGPKVVGKGLGAINTGLDMVLQGVSCAKLVVEIGE
ncbi:GroES-like protein [Apiospora saccharicola]|uniref:GroES-like protein n=1 Tax=Apiospora saccharicola TaxID=335842 RepID=A0ABR1UZ16_9PEZI